MDDKAFLSYRKEIVKISNNNMSKSNQVVDYDEAEQIVVDFIAEKKVLDMQVNDGEIDFNRNLTKEDLRRGKKRTEKLVSDCLLQNNISVRGYSGKLDLFIDEMVNEYSGYSILEDAFNDPDVDDIYSNEIAISTLFNAGATIVLDN